MLDRLIAVVEARASADGRRWLGEALAQCAAGQPLASLLRSYTAASRRVGRAALAPTAVEADAFAAAVPGFSLAQWTVDDAARAALLLSTAAAERDRGRFYDLATGCYEQGDAREQQSWLRALALLPEPERFTMIAIDACRTNIIPLFESIACENPFPARYFPERNFNQLVLKALFNAVALDRIVHLSSRLNPELSRMAEGYASERRAAGRSVPADIELAKGLR